MTESEKLAWFWFWRQVGERMLIRGIPDSYADFERFSGAYEAAHFRFTTAGQSRRAGHPRVVRRLVSRALRPLVRHSIHALLDQALRTAFDLPPAPRWLVWAVERALRARSWALRWLPQRRRPQRRTQIPVPTIHGIRIDPGPPCDRWEQGRGSASVESGDAYDDGGALIPVCPFADRRMKGGKDGQGHGTAYRTHGE
jgi:hypothetical protein